ncbi:MAG: stage III sporulation AC/AD family protein [Oscillospiraceae bacterium]|nr:stage III sporulation AC/AD family protein [Oscillospiraceae bacterium]
MIIRLVGTALIGVILIAVIKKRNPEQGLMLSIAAVCAMSLLSAAVLTEIINWLREMAESFGLEGTVFETLIKVLGISLIIRITADLCRDAEEKGIATAVEVGGTALAIFIAMPLFNSVLTLIKSILPV